jgi:UDP-glucuronate 4-epimerase
MKVFNNGDMERDFTYIDDIVEGTARIMSSIPANTSPYRILNIGNGSPVKLLSFIETMEKYLGKKTDKILMPMQPGDVKQPWAETNELETTVNYKPKIGIDAGIEKFIQWFRLYFEN